MKKKILLIVSAIILILSSLSACGNSGKSESNSGTVTIWSWRSQDKQIWKDVEEQMNKNGKKIKINFRSFTPTQYDASLQTAMKGGKGPDILTLRGGAGISKYATAKQIVPLDNIATGLKDYSKGVLGQVQTNGKSYAVPFAVQTSQFFYNKDLFVKYNLQEPKTWAELVDSMKTLKNHGVAPMGISGREGWALALILDSVGASQLGDPWVKGLIAGENHFTDSKYVNVLTNINNLKTYFQKSYSAASYQDMETLFAQGKVAMIVDGIWAAKTIQDQNPNLKIGSFLAPPENASQKAHIYAFVDGGYGLNAKSKNNNAAKEVIKFVSTKEYAQLYTDTFGEIPGYPGVTPKKGTALLNTAMKNYKESAINQLFRIRSPFSSGDPAIDTLVSAGLQELFAGKKTPDTLAGDIQKNIAKWYKPFKK